MSKKEILYRGKRTDNGEWAEGLPSYDINGHITEIEVFKGFACCYPIEVDPETVCQYTGLTDKNGRKIFEGDIIKHYNDGLNPMKFNIVVIKWSEEGCVYVQQSSLGMEYRIFSRYRECYEVIGNIFDNPELIEQEVS